MNHQPFLQLIEQIRSESKSSLEGEQLACIAQLIYHCGVLAREIPKMKVGQVIDNDGAIISEIDCSGARPIHLNEEALAAIEHYIAQLRQKLPTFMDRQARLFPSYRNTDKLKRDLKRFDTTCSAIKEAGYFNFHQNEKRKGRRETRIFQEGGKQLRVTARQFRAVVTGNKIRPGMSVDNRCAEDLMRLLEDAEHLKKKAANAPAIARGIMARFKKIVAGIRSKQLRDDYGQVFGEQLEEVLGDLIK